MRPQFQAFRATELYCPQCGVSQPIRERPVAGPGPPTTDLHCARCDTHVGQHTVADNSLSGKLSKFVGKLLKK